MGYKMYEKMEYKDKEKESLELFLEKFGRDFTKILEKHYNQIMDQTVILVNDFIKKSLEEKEIEDNDYISNYKNLEKVPLPQISAYPGRKNKEFEEMAPIKSIGSYPEPLSPNQLAILDSLDEHGSMNQKELIKLTILPQSSVSVALKKLRELGYLNSRKEKEKGLVYTVYEMIE